MTPGRREPRLSILVPVVERTDDLPEVHGSVREAVERLGESFEFLYLVSAEFSEAFAQILALRQREPDWVRVVRFGQPVSEATALAVGFERARGEIVISVPSYFDADPKGLGDLVEAIRQGADVAVAKRTQRQGGVFRRLQALSFNRLAAWATGTRFTDLGSGMRAARREVLSEVALYGDFHRFFPVLVERLGFVVREVPVEEDTRAQAPQLYRLRTYVWRLLDLLSMFFLSHFTRRPLRLFGAAGAAFGALGGGILVIVAVQRFLGEPLAGRPVLMLGALLLGIGVQMFTIGLLGELLLFFHAREVRDYRIAETIEPEPPPLPPRPSQAE